MLKYVTLLKRKEEMSLEAFQEYLLNQHIPIARRIPGMREYRVSIVEVDNPDSLYDAIADHWFDDPAAAAAAGETPEGQAASQDIAAHCSTRVYLVTREYHIIDSAPGSEVHNTL